MKRALLFRSCLCLLLVACGDQKKDEINKLAEVLKVHDHVMANDELLMGSKRRLDSLIKTPLTGTADTAAEKVKIKGIQNRLSAADENMENWMHRFDAEQKGKSHREKMDYLETQRKQITAVDTQLTGAISAADNYLKTIKHK